MSAGHASHPDGWSLGLTIGPIVALVLLWDDSGSTLFVRTAIVLGIVVVGMNEV